MVDIVDRLAWRRTLANATAVGIALRDSVVRVPMWPPVRGVLTTGLLTVAGKRIGEIRSILRRKMSA